jgi:hypothetical protein
VGHRRNKEEFRKFLEFNENENTVYQNLWDTAKAILKGMFIAMTAYIKRTEQSQINNLILHLKILEKQEQTKSKTSRRRKKIKIRPKSMKSRPKKPYKLSMK